MVRVNPMTDAAAPDRSDTVVAPRGRSRARAFLSHIPATLTLSAAETFGDLLVNSTTLTNISLTGATSQNITLSGGGSSG